MLIGHHPFKFLIFNLLSFRSISKTAIKAVSVAFLNWVATDSLTKEFKFSFKLNSLVLFSSSSMPSWLCEFKLVFDNFFKKKDNVCCGNFWFCDFDVAHFYFILKNFVIKFVIYLVGSNLVGFDFQTNVWN